MNDRLTRMVFATAALAAVAAVLAGAAGASIGQSRPAAVVVPYLSHGIGVDASQFAGQPSQTIPYLSQGVGVDPAAFSGQASPRLPGVHAALLGKQSPPIEPTSLGLTGDSPLTRVSAPEPEGLTGDMALTRVPGAAPAATAVSGGNDVDWTSFGAGAGIAALLAAALVGILLASRRRQTVGMP